MPKTISKPLMARKVVLVAQYSKAFVSYGPSPLMHFSIRTSQ
jgi:hypothetical protein